MGAERTAINGIAGEFGGCKSVGGTPVITAAFGLFSFWIGHDEDCFVVDRAKNGHQ